MAEVVRNLTLRDKEKKLSTGERKMLESARLILVSELALVANVGEEQALVTIEDAVNSSLCIEDELFEES